MKVGVIIPAYQAGPRLGTVLLKTNQYIPADFICVVNDGSNDNTSDIAKTYGVNLIEFTINRGKGEALKAGFQWALEKGLEAVITMDADGQHDPDLIPEFIQCMHTGKYDVVLGTRQFKPGIMPFDRILSNKISSMLVSIAAGTRIQDSQNGFRLFRASVLRDLHLKGSLYELESEILIRLGKKHVLFGQCRVPAAYAGAPSHIRRLRDIRRFMTMWFDLVRKRKDSA